MLAQGGREAGGGGTEGGNWDNCSSINNEVSFKFSKKKEEKE